jgi:hypothetical protein
MRKLDIACAREKLAVYAKAGLLALGDGRAMPQLACSTAVASRQS